MPGHFYHRARFIKPVVCLLLGRCLLSEGVIQLEDLNEGLDESDPEGSSEGSSEGGVFQLVMGVTPICGWFLGGENIPIQNDQNG